MFFCVGYVLIFGFVVFDYVLIVLFGIIWFGG